MSAPYNPPVKNEDFKLRIALEDYANPGNFKSNPTIASGDFKVAVDATALANLTTTPTVSPASSVLVLVELSASEMNGDVITIVGIDQTAPKEWADIVISIPTTSA
jgi:hypothetical protein